MNNHKNTLRFTIIEIISAISDILSIFNSLIRLVRRLPKRNHDSNRFLKKLSWFLILIALLCSRLISGAAFELANSLNVHEGLSLLIAISIQMAVIIPTVMQAHEDKILTAFVHQDLTK